MKEKEILKDINSTLRIIMAGIWLIAGILFVMTIT